jgi:RimJ/RimL family protein N-acetyltransferase
MQLTTPRLLLREMRESDLDAFTTFYSDPLYQRYEGSPMTRAQVREKLEKAIASSLEEPRKRYRLAITILPEDTAKGLISLSENNPSIREWEIGWGLHPACWGKGYTPEAARAMLSFAFSELKAHRVTAFCHADNHASIRVMEKIGMQREGRLRQVRWLNDQWWDEYVYSIVESE